MKRVWAFCVCVFFCALFLWGEEFTPGGVVLVLDNLRLRSAGSMDGSAIVTIQKGSLLEVMGTGKNETIDGIDSSWVKVKVLESTQDKDGRLVQEETEGWCFGGYLTTVKGGKKYEICFPGVGTQSVVIDSIYEYNRDGKEIYTRTSDGFEKWYEYDENGNEIYWKTSGGREQWYEYDENGNEIYRKTSDGYEEWSEYDERGKLIHFKNSENNEYWHEYDENGNWVYGKNSFGNETVRKYDEKGNVIYRKDYEGKERWYEYDENGNCILETTFIGDEIRRKYNKRGDCVYIDDSDGTRYLIEYVYWPDGSIRKEMTFFRVE